MKYLVGGHDGSVSLKGCSLTCFCVPAAPAHTDAYAIVEVTPDFIHIQGAGSVTSRQLHV